MPLSYARSLAKPRFFGPRMWVPRRFTTTKPAAIASSSRIGRYAEISKARVSKASAVKCQDGGYFGLRIATTPTARHNLHMPCLLGCLALLFPRVVIVLVVIFSDYIGQAYQTILWPLLG